MEYEVILEFGNGGAYKSAGSFEKLEDAFNCMKEEFINRDSDLTVIYIDKVKLKTLENSEFLTLRIEEVTV